MSHFITTHDANGKSTLSSKIPTSRNARAMPGGGSLEIVHTSHTLTPDVSAESDIDQYAQDRENGLPNGALCPPSGVSAAIVNFPPGATSPNHRTMTLDILVILEGEVEMHLEDGTVCTAKAGDTITQRGTMHQWKNVTPNQGWMRMMAFCMPVKEPIVVGGKELGTEWHR